MGITIRFGTERQSDSRAPALPPNFGEGNELRFAYWGFRAFVENTNAPFHGLHEGASVRITQQFRNSLRTSAENWKVANATNRPLRYEDYCRIFDWAIWWAEHATTIEVL